MRHTLELRLDVRYPSLLEQFVTEECTTHVRALLQTWLEAHGESRQPEPRRWEFNRFEVSLDLDGNAIILEDILDPSDAGRLRITVDEFAAALATGGPRTLGGTP